MERQFFGGVETSVPSSVRSQSSSHASPEHAEVSARISQIKSLVESGFVRFDYEEILRAQYTKWVRPGDTVLDVGAHTGRHLKQLIELVGRKGRVLAFEPIPFAYQHLSSAYGRPNVVIHNVALSDVPGRSQFTYAQGTPEESGLRRRIYNNPRLADPKKIEVMVKTLDQFIDDVDSIRFIKIDIEGGEVGCLRGAGQILAKYRPVLSVEYGFPSYSAYGHSRDTIFDLANSLGYSLCDLFGNVLTDRRTWHLACDSIYWDFFMVPVEAETGFSSALKTGVPS